MTDLLNEFENPIEQGLYPIRTVAAETGVNPVTLRAWERRYGLIKPTRTPKGHRLYSSDDIELIKNILTFLDKGVSIGQVKGLLSQPSQTPHIQESDIGTWDQYQERLNHSIRVLDVKGIDAALNDALSLYPMEMVGQQLILPLLDSLNTSKTENAEQQCQYALYKSYLRNKLGARFHHQSNQVKGSELQIVALGDTSDEVRLLLFALTALARGYRVNYFGQLADLDSLDHLLQHKPGKAFIVQIESLSPSEYKRLSSISENSESPIALLTSKRDNLLNSGFEERKSLTLLSEEPTAAIAQLEKGW